jgi:hypothetical protein
LTSEWRRTIAAYLKALKRDERRFALNGLWIMVSA